MKRLYLHIGSHKTGSTSIQEALFQAQEVLGENGFSYFAESPHGGPSSRGKTAGWIKIPADFASTSPTREKATIYSLGTLVEKINGLPNDNVVMSVENFSWIVEREEIEKLHNELVRFFDVRVIAYIRRQDELAISHHQEGSKYPDRPAAKYYGGDNKALPSNPNHYYDYLDFNKKFSNWADVFGKDRVVLRVFDRELLQNGDVVQDFLSLIGLGSLDLSYAETNISNGFERTKIGHLLNNSRLPEEIQQAIRAGANNDGKSLPSQSMAREFYEKYIDSNIELNRAFGLSSRHEDIFGQDFSAYPKDRQDLWTEDSANRAINTIFESLETLIQNEPHNLIRTSQIPRLIYMKLLNRLKR